ncbi:cell wall synthesis protein CwsA [Williamsia soli]|uniref:cell wall synthesis protein CwsA n=1 Tax=Williamsia soli TaxID=364929 RepID=UPI001A9D627B|nr:cell wall synthesis protein CwsA [Williamsia soli]
MSRSESELKVVRDRAVALNAAAQSAATTFWSGAKNLTAQGSDLLPVRTRPASRRRLKIALVSVGVLAAGAAAFSITRRTRPQPPSVAAAPPRLADVPVAGEEARTPDQAAGTV